MCTDILFNQFVNIFSCVLPIYGKYIINYKMDVSAVESCNINNQTESVVKENEMELEVKDIKKEVSPLKEEQTERSEKENPFAYLDRNDFTSEKFKVEVRNLPKHYGIAVSNNLIFDIHIWTKMFIVKVTLYFLKFSGVQEISQYKVKIE